MPNIANELKSKMQIKTLMRNHLIPARIYNNKDK